MNSFKSDIAIVGSGIAGALAAYTLVKNGLKVLLLEAGPEISSKQIIDRFTKTPFLDFSSGYPNEVWAPRPNLASGDDNYINYVNQKWNMSYLKNVGGNTWHWAGICARLLPSDFQMKRN